MATGVRGMKSQQPVVWQHDDEYHDSYYTGRIFEWPTVSFSTQIILFYDRQVSDRCYSDLPWTELQQFSLVHCSQC